MTKQEILDKFNDIDFVYNDSSKHETLSRMLDELLKEQETHKFFVDESGKITPLPVVVRCKDCKHFDETQRGKEREENRHYVCDDFNPTDDWYCADGEHKEGR